MNDTVFICPPKQSLLLALQRRCVVVDLPSFRGLAAAFDLAKRCNVALRCIRVRHPGLLTEIKPDDSWNDIPLALSVDGVGKFRDLAPLLPILRRLNMRVYVPASSAENLAGIRILSSLGLAAAALIDRTANWAGCSDLCIYALLGITPHSPVEPFMRLAEHYSETGANRLTASLFDDPSVIFHVNEGGCVARSSAALARGEFIAPSIEQFLASPPPPPDSTIDELAKNGPCSSCPALNVCFGEVSDPANCPEAAKEFFSDLLDTVEQSKSQNRRMQRTLWQT